MYSMTDKANDWVGKQLNVAGNDYGIVVDWFCIGDGYESQYVLVTDTGRRVGLASVIRYFSSMANAAHFPDGTDYSHRFAGPQKLYRAEPYCAANIPNTARVGNDTIRINKLPGNGKEK